MGNALSPFQGANEANKFIQASMNAPTNLSASGVVVAVSNIDGSPIGTNITVSGAGTTPQAPDYVRIEDATTTTLAIVNPDGTLQTAIGRPLPTGANVLGQIVVASGVTLASGQLPSALSADRLKMALVTGGGADLTIGDGTNGLKVQNLALPPLNTSIVAGAQNGTATQVATDITNATVGANKVFQGSVSVSAAATVAVNANTAGTLAVYVNWVPGTSGTAAQRVAAVDLTFPANGAAGAGLCDSDTVTVPLMLYAGTTGGKFQCTATATGTINTLQFDVVVNGMAA